MRNVQAKSDRMAVQRWIDIVPVVSRRHLFVCGVCFMHVVSVRRVVRSAPPGTRVRASVLTGLGHVHTLPLYTATVYTFPWRYREFAVKLLRMRDTAAKWPFSLPHFTGNSANLLLSQFALYDEFFQHHRESQISDLYPAEGASRWNFKLCKRDIIIKLLQSLTALSESEADTDEMYVFTLREDVS